MSQDRVERQLGFTTRSLYRWENDAVDPGFEKVCQLAELYGVSLDWIAGRTAIERCVRPGMVMIDNQVIGTLEALVADGKSILDVPDQFIRGPSLSCFSVVPSDPEFVAEAAVGPVEARMRRLWKQLGGTTA